MEITKFVFQFLSSKNWCFCHSDILYALFYKLYVYICICDSHVFIRTNSINTYNLTIIQPTYLTLSLGDYLPSIFT